jgi:hypothetical protein
MRGKGKRLEATLLRVVSAFGEARIVLPEWLVNESVI